MFQLAMFAAVLIPTNQGYEMAIGDGKIVQGVIEQHAQETGKKPLRRAIAVGVGAQLGYAMGFILSGKLIEYDSKDYQLSPEIWGLAVATFLGMPVVGVLIPMLIGGDSTMTMAVTAGATIACAGIAWLSGSLISVALFRNVKDQEIQSLAGLTTVLATGTVVMGVGTTVVNLLLEDRADH